MKKSIWLSAWLVAMAFPLRASPADSSTPPPWPVSPPAGITNLWFEVGEEVIYNIYWGVVHVGYSHVMTSWVTHEDGRTLLQIRFESRSNKVLAMLYPVEDVQEVRIDPATFLPVTFRKISRQGRRRYDELTTFNHAAGEAVCESFLHGKKKTVPIDPDTRDLISLMYLMRSLDVTVGEERTWRVFTDEKIYDLFVKVPRKEVVELDRYGKIESLLFDPEAAFNGLFVRKGKVHMWVSDDARKLCTKVTAKVPVASVEIRLAEVKGPGMDFWVAPVDESQAARPSAMPSRRGR